MSKPIELYGCCVDDCDMEGCVFDGADGFTIEDCGLAIELNSKGFGRDDCQHWVRRERPYEVTRKAFICKHCEGVYADELVTECDCGEGSGADFYEGTIQYKKE